MTSVGVLILPHGTAPLACIDEDILWIKSSPTQTRLRDSDVLSEDDVRQFTKRGIAV
jgi:hypothetical protein